MQDLGEALVGLRQEGTVLSLCSDPAIKIIESEGHGLIANSADQAP